MKLVRNSQAVSVARRAIVLIAVLVVVVVLSLAGYQYSDLMTSEYAAASAMVREMQARSFAESGIHYAAALISDPANAGQLFDNPELFQGQIVAADTNGGGHGRFSIVAPPLDPAGASGNQSFRFGLADESGKINLNALVKTDRRGQVARNVLMKLPNMSDDIANAILDWIDADADVRTGGAENETYGTMEPPYRAKNGPLDSVEELLLVRGITPALLFGDDRNRNGLLDPGESTPAGWSAYFTVYSRELNLDSAGQPRIDLNEKDLESLYQKLSGAVGDDIAKFIVLARQYGTSSKSKDSSNKGGASKGGSGNESSKGGGRSPGGSGGKGGSGSLGGLSRGGMMGGKSSGKQKKASKISSVYDLIDVQVSVPSEDPKGEPTVYTSPLSGPNALKQYLPDLLDKTTTSTKMEIPARINVNTAPDAVLMALPELTESQAQAVLAARPQNAADDPVYQTTTWLSTEANLPPATMKKLERYITTRSQVYRLQSIGYFEEGGPVVRLEAVIDANNGRPRILFWRDLSDLGKGYDVR